MELSPEFVARLSRILPLVERVLLVKQPARALSRPLTIQAPAWCLGKLDEDLASDKPVPATIWRYDESADDLLASDADYDHLDAVRAAPWLDYGDAPDTVFGKILADTFVRLEFYGQKWWVTDWQRGRWIYAKLSADLKPGKHVTAKVSKAYSSFVDSGQTVEVYAPALLKTGQLNSGTIVKADWQPEANDDGRSGAWFVNQAMCDGS